MRANQSTRITAASGYLPGLDGLRAIAILLVILCHVNLLFSGEFPSSGLERVVARIFGAGWVGVDLFFVLSGFLITRILVRAKGSENYFRNFYMRRALRIVPVYYVYCAVLVVMFWMPKGHPDFGGAELISVLTYSYNLRAAFLGHHLAATGHLWSLAVEEHFYFVWPLLVLLMSRSRLRTTCIFIGCGSLAARILVLQMPHGYISAYVLTPCRLDSLGMGAWLGLLDETQREWLRRHCRSLAAAALGGLAAIAIYQGHIYSVAEPGATGRGSALVLTAGLSLLAVLFACLVTMGTAGGFLTRMLELPVLRWVGIRSYGIYVFHQLVIDQTASRVIQSRWATGVPGYAMKMITVLMALAIALPLSALSYRFLEMPFLRLKRFFSTEGPNGSVRLVNVGKPVDLGLELEPVLVPDGD